MLRTTACIAALIGALGIAAPALAGNGNGGGSDKSTITLVQPSGAASTSTAWPHYGDQVSFDVSTSQTGSLWVNLQCFQGGKLVGQGWANLADSEPVFTLASPSWTGGDAKCTARLDNYVNGRMRSLASTSFDVSQ